MNQKQPERPSKIIMLAPIAIVLAVYSFLFFSPQQAKLRSTQSRFAALSESHQQTEHEVTDVQFESGRVKKEMRDLADQIHELQHEQDELLAQRNQMRHTLESHALPAATMQHVTRLMETHQLRVLESQQDSGAANQVERTLKSLLNLLKDDQPAKNSKHIPHHTPHHPHHTHDHDHHFDSPAHTHFTREVYKLKVRGRFQDLQAALESLAAELEHVLPLSLQMEPMELDSTEARQPQRVWTLTILV